MLVYLRDTKLLFINYKLMITTDFKTIEVKTPTGKIKKIYRYTEEWYKTLLQEEKAKEERKAEFKKLKQLWKEENLKTYNIWEIVYNSRWYEQTNIDFYQIIDRKWSKVLLKAIGSEYIAETDMSWYKTPIKDYFIEKEDKNQGWKMINSYWITCEYGCLRIAKEKKYFTSSRA